MIRSLSRAFDNLFGRGGAAVTVPPLDGALRPNRLLDEAVRRMPLPEVDCLAVHAGQLVASVRDAVHAADGAGGWTPRGSYRATITAIAPVGDDGLAVALDDGEILIDGGRHHGRVYQAGKGVRCITAMASDGEALYVASGSSKGGTDDWQLDLIGCDATGSIWRVDLATADSRRISDGLAWPAGLAIDGSGIVFSEAWRHRLARVDPDRRGLPRTIHSDLPGYPGRLSPASGGWWLAMFAPRTQLVEFVLREPAYRRRMVAEVPREFWVAPKLRSGRSYYEPLQGGGVKHLGLLKPWAPTMSFGMCVWLDAAFRPRHSLQSRADGATHGITSVVEHEGWTVAAARGDGVVVRLPSKVAEPGGVS